VRHFAFALVLTFCLGPLQGATLERLSMDDMIAKSTAIVHARVNGSFGAFQGPLIYTHYKLQVSETLKGAAVAEVLVPGGTANGARQSIPGAPALADGGDYVIFLWTGKAGDTQIIGLTQGLFSVAKAGGADPTVTRAASTEVMLEAGTGQVVKDETLVMKLSELKARVAAGLVTK
jgi:hypothetical protein